MKIVLQSDEGVDLLHVYVLTDPGVEIQAVHTDVTYVENGAPFRLGLKLMPWSDVEQIAAWVRSCGDEFIGIADGILEGKKLPPQKPDESRGTTTKARLKLEERLRRQRANLEATIAELQRLDDEG